MIDKAFNICIILRWAWNSVYPKAFRICFREKAWSSLVSSVIIGNLGNALFIALSRIGKNVVNIWHSPFRTPSDWHQCDQLAKYVRRGILFYLYVYLLFRHVDVCLHFPSILLNCKAILQVRPNLLKLYIGVQSLIFRLHENMLFLIFFFCLYSESFFCTIK